MDPIDLALEHAWHVVAHRLKSDPAEARRRFARLGTPALQRPMRAWCLCVRASDTRISDRWWQVEDAHAKMKYPPHWVWIDAAKLRELVKPVFIPWPGVDWTVAARELGRHPVSLRTWIERGVLRCKRVNARSVRKIGNPVPYVYTESPLDPNGEFGRGPDGVWGHMWQGFYKKVPENFGQVVRRVARLRAYGNMAVRRFRGWEFECQGRLIPMAADAPERMREMVLGAHRARNEKAAIVERGGEDEEPARMYVHLPCGRRVDSMFCPLPVWTIAKSLGQDLGLEIGGEARGGEEGQEGTKRDERGGLKLAGGFSAGLADPTLPGMEDWAKETTARSFACARCWGVRYGALSNRHGWNEFVSHLTGGLLYGREVARPAEAAAVRKRRPFTHAKPRRVAVRPEIEQRRARVLGLLVAGATRGRIAAEIGVTMGAVNRDVEAVYRRYGVRGRGELVAAIASGRGKRAVA